MTFQQTQKSPEEIVLQKFYLLKYTVWAALVLLGVVTVLLAASALYLKAGDLPISANTFKVIGIGCMALPLIFIGMVWKCPSCHSSFASKHGGAVFSPTFCPYCGMGFRLGLLRKQPPEIKTGLENANFPKKKFHLKRLLELLFLFIVLLLPLPFLVLAIKVQQMKLLSPNMYRDIGLLLIAVWMLTTFFLIKRHFKKFGCSGCGSPMGPLWGCCPKCGLSDVTRCEGYVRF